MQVTTLHSMPMDGLRLLHWQVSDQYFLVELYYDGVAHLFRSNATGQKIGENLVGHNTHGVGDCKRVALEIVASLHLEREDR